MFCEYLVDIKVIYSNKSFEEECRIEPTEQEWNRAFKYRNNRVLKVIRFSDDFEKSESHQYVIPLNVSKEDRIKFYTLLGDDAYWLECLAEHRTGVIHKQLREIWQKYENEKEMEYAQKLKEEHEKTLSENTKKQQEFEKRLPEIKKKMKELDRKAGLIK